MTVAVAVTMAAACGNRGRQQFAGDIVRITAETPGWVEKDPLGKRLWATTQAFYEERQHLPAWIDGHTPTSQLDELLEALRDADRHGLDPETYGLAELEAAREQADEAWFGASFEDARIPELDVRFTYAFVSHAADLLGWGASPRQIHRNWLPAPKKVDFGDVLRQAIDEGDVQAALGELAPSHAQYTGLQAALAKARESGSDDEAGRIRLNLERWRWAPRDLGDRHILVNVPGYRMQVVEDESPVLDMRVIVGATETPTPLFSDRMTYVVFSPYWNIPESILREETLPRVVSDPEYLQRSSIEVVGTSGEVVDPEEVDWEDEEALQGLRLRQTPGPENALGLVKFIFPNNFAVYLHDTPTTALFEKEMRTFSHGCIRVEKPVDLAEYVLSDNSRWTSDRIVQAMNATTEQTVHLEEPLPVHIGYWTAWVEDDGSVRFTDDPYGYDKRHARLRAE